MTFSSPVMITGAAGDIARAMATILRLAQPSIALIGADIRAVEGEPAPFDHMLVLPRATDPAYRPALVAALQSNAVATLIPGSEAELEQLLDWGWLSGSAPLRVISANARAVEIGLDKLATNQLLHEAGIAAPWTAPVSAGPPQALPCILKQRKGQGSKGFEILQEEPSADVMAARSGDVFQQFLPDAEAEFTCGLYRGLAGETRTVILRRKLRGGLTGEAVVDPVPAIDTLLHRIADLVELRGSINVQLRLLEGVPMVFEINPRFSSTVGFRDEIGFSDLLWAIGEAEGQGLPPYAPAAAGLRYTRPA